MELLIPGLILVALMVWASTKIKKTAADAFEAERIQTSDYELDKPAEFLHVLGDPDHEFFAYSKEMGEGESNSVRRATIELDLLRDESVSGVVDSVGGNVINSKAIGDFNEIETEELANETPV